MKLILAAVFAFALVPSVRSEDKAAVSAPAGWAGFFKNLKSSLAQSAVGGERKKGRGAQGVAAVRGAGQGKKNIADPDEPGIKGDSRSAKAKKEMGYDVELEASIDLISAGKLEQGLKGLEAFKVAHPKHRTEDVDKAIEGVKAMVAANSGAPASQDEAVKAIVPDEASKPAEAVIAKP